MSDSTVPNTAEMSDAELAEEIAELRAEIQNISEQIDDDKEDGFPRGAPWRGRAKAARGYMRRDLAVLEAARKARSATPDKLFVLAARSVLSQDVFGSMWETAKAMFPDSPAWLQAEDIANG